MEPPNNRVINDMIKFGNNKEQAKQCHCCFAEPAVQQNGNSAVCDGVGSCAFLHPYIRASLPRKAAADTVCLSLSLHWKAGKYEPFLISQNVPEPSLHWLLRGTVRYGTGSS